MNGGRRVDVMSTWVKEDQAILHLEEHPRGQFIETTQEIACTLTQEIEEEEEHVVSLSEGDDVEDETYRISPRAGRRAALMMMKLWKRVMKRMMLRRNPLGKLKKRRGLGQGDCKSQTKRKSSFPSQANNKMASQSPKL
jgi:hypothetical protein